MAATAGPAGKTNFSIPGVTPQRFAHFSLIRPARGGIHAIRDGCNADGRKALRRERLRCRETDLHSTDERRSAPCDPHGKTDVGFYGKIFAAGNSMPGSGNFELPLTAHWFRRV